MIIFEIYSALVLFSVLMLLVDLYVLGSKKLTKKYFLDILYVSTFYCVIMIPLTLYDWVGYPVLKRLRIMK